MHESMPDVRVGAAHVFGTCVLLGCVGYGGGGRFLGCEAHAPGAAYASLGPGGNTGQPGSAARLCLGDEIA